jgi:hypothetical protein
MSLRCFRGDSVPQKRVAVGRPLANAAPPRFDSKNHLAEHSRNLLRPFYIFISASELAALSLQVVKAI